MSYSQPTPPQELPKHFVQTLDDRPPELLRQIAQYAEELAEYREREERLARQKDEDDQIEQRPEEFPDNVPTKATLTVKEINNNRYYYWQWREGDNIKSRYKEPVDLDE